jgi:flagella basal body P-ring formation protein FlgA
MRKRLLACAMAGVLGVSLSTAEAGAARFAREADVVAAIVKAVHERMGSDVRVEIGDLQVRGDLEDAVAILAKPDPGVRLGARTRVSLKALRGRGRGVRIGEAECVIRVSAPHYVAAGAIARGEAIAATLVERRDDWLEGLPLKPLPLDLESARATRDLGPGDVVRSQDVVVPPPVRAGQSVRVHVRLGRVRVSVDGVAAQDGSLGEEIRIVNPSSGRALRARVVGPAAVEVQHGT